MIDSDARTWRAIVDEHADDLLRFARSFGGSSADAEDLVQDAFLRAYRARDGYRADASLRTWLHSIVRNLAIDRARRPERELSMDDVEDAWHDDAYTVDAAEVVAAAERSDELSDALSRLSHAYRAVVVLHDVEGWTVAEIATALDLGLPAAKQRLRRGRMALVSALAGDPGRPRTPVGVPLRCWDARRHVSDYLDDLLDAGTRAQVEAHLAGCPTCPALAAALVGTTAALSGSRDPDVVFAPDLAERIASRLDAP